MTYVVEMMTDMDYHIYRNGGRCLATATLVEGLNKEDALVKAKERYPNYVINEETVYTCEEKEAEQKRKIEQYVLYLQKKAEEKLAKDEKARKKLEEQANKCGMTVENFKKKKFLEKRMKETVNNIDRLETNLENEKNYLENLKKQLTKLQADAIL